MLAQTYALPRGPRVRLRLARPRDAAAIRALFRRRGTEVEELELARLIQFDPRRRLTICAMALIGSTETVVGVGAIELGDEVPLAPTSLYVDEQLTDGLADLLTRALVGRAGALVRARAA